MKQSEQPIANPVVVLREEFEDWAILFNPDTADAVGINPVGVIVWKLINGKKELTEIIEKAIKQCSGVSKTVNDEITEFIEKLIEYGFVGFELN